jgi:hypothetical protein
MSPRVDVQTWSSITDEPLSEAAIRARYPAAKYRVCAYRYPAWARFNGAMRRATCYVLSGACRHAFIDVDATVREGEVVELPGGDYSFEVLDDEPLVMVLCWELPFEVNHIQ